MRCSQCGHANPAGSAFCAACYLTLAPIPAAGPLPAAHAPALPPAERMSGGTAAALVGGVLVGGLVLGGLLERSLDPLRTGVDGVGLESAAFGILVLGLLCAAGALLLGVHLARRPRGVSALLAGLAVGPLLGPLVAWSLVAAAQALARAPVYEGVAQSRMGTMGPAAALLLGVAGGVVVALAQDRMRAALALALAVLATFSVALVASGAWLLDHAAYLQMLAQAREHRYYAPFPPALMLVAVGVAAALMRRRRA